MDKRYLLSSVALAALSFGVQPAWARIGIASAVEGAPVGKPPEATERVLRVGVDVAANERITTTADDRAHLVFEDGTSLTVAPNSVVVIDKYIFDPDRARGEMAVSVTKGALRFVGGKISKSSEVTIKTPSASMGIRGGIVTVAVSPTGATTANLLFGTSLSVTSQGVTRTTTQSGMQINVNQGAPPTIPATIPPAALQNNVAVFQQGGNQQFVASANGFAPVPTAPPPGARVAVAAVVVAASKRALMRLADSPAPAPAVGRGRQAARPVAELVVAPVAPLAAVLAVGPIGRRFLRRWRTPA